MDLRKIREMVTKDMPIDGTELDLESLKIPQLHNKYLNLYSDEKLVAKKLEFDYKALRRLKWEYYTGKLDEDKLEELSSEIDDSGFSDMQELERQRNLCIKKINTTNKK